MPGTTRSLKGSRISKPLNGFRLGTRLLELCCTFGRLSRIGLRALGHSHHHHHHHHLIIISTSTITITIIIITTIVIETAVVTVRVANCRCSPLQGQGPESLKPQTPVVPMLL